MKNPKPKGKVAEVTSTSPSKKIKNSNKTTEPVYGGIPPNGRVI